MKNAVRKILNYKPRGSTKTEQQEFTSIITALALSFLESDYGFKPLYDANVELNKKHASFYVDNNICLNSRFFKTSNSLGSDIIVAGHEVCHLAQDFSSETFGSFTDKPVLNIPTQRYFKLFYEKILEYYPDVKESDLNEEKIDQFIIENPKYELIYDYFYSLYYLKPIENEATEFGLFLLEIIIDIAEHLTLNSSEKRNLENLKSNYEEEKNEIINSKNIYKSVASNPNIQKTVENFAKEIRENIFKKYPDIISDLKYLSSYEFAKKYNNSCKTDSYDPFENLILTLEIDYDDKLAHSIYDALTSSNPAINYDYISTFTLFSKIKLTKKELQNFKEVLTTLNYTLDSKLTIEDFLIQKQQIADELEEIKSPSSGPIF